MVEKFKINNEGLLNGIIAGIGVGGAGSSLGFILLYLQYVNIDLLKFSIIYSITTILTLATLYVLRNKNE